MNDELLRSFRQLSVLHTPRSALVLLLLAVRSLVRLAADPLGFESQAAS